MILANCTNCGIFSQDRLPGFSFGAVTSVQISNVYIDCPFCGQSAKIVDGIYKFTTVAFEALRDVQLSRNQARRIVRVVENTKDLEVAAEKLSHINSEVGTVAKKVLSTDSPREYLRQISYVVAILAGITGTAYSALGVADYLGFLDEVRSVVGKGHDQKVKKEDLEAYSSYVLGKKNDTSEKELRPLKRPEN